MFPRSAALKITRQSLLWCTFKCAGSLFLPVRYNLDLQDVRGSTWRNVKSVLNLPIFGNAVLPLSLSLPLSLHFSRFPIVLHRWISAGPFLLFYKLENGYLDYVSNHSSLNFNHQTPLNAPETLTVILCQSLEIPLDTFQHQRFHSPVYRLSDI